MRTFYVISEEKLLSLLNAERELNALECAGVDNWISYPYRYDDFNEEDYPEWTPEMLKEKFTVIYDSEGIIK